MEHNSCHSSTFMFFLAPFILALMDLDLGLIIYLRRVSQERRMCPKMLKYRELCKYPRRTWFVIKINPFVYLRAMSELKPSCGW